MRIDEITLYAGQMPVKVLFSYGTMACFNFLILEIRSEDAVGYGESMTPVPVGFTDYLQGLIGADARRLDNLLPRSFTAPLVRIAHESVSIALHDLVARRAGLPLGTLLGGMAATEIPLMPCIFPQNPDEAGELAAKWRQCGFRHLKTKLLGRFSEDVARVKAIRAAVPDLVTLQGDANCGYQSLEVCVKVVKALEEAGLDIFEDPMAGLPEKYADLRRRLGGCRVKIMIDEFARTSKLLVRTLKANAADVVNIHPDQPGSLTAARRNIQLAQSFNVPVLLCGTGYTGIGSIAYQQLAAALLPGMPCGELGGFWDHGMPASSCTHHFPVKDGHITFDPAVPGTGAAFDEEAMRPYIETRRVFH